MVRIISTFSKVVQKIVELDKFARENKISSKGYLSDKLTFKVMGPFSEVIRSEAYEKGLGTEWFKYNLGFLNSISGKVLGHWQLQSFFISNIQGSNNVYIFLIYVSSSEKKVNNTISLRYELTYSQLNYLLNLMLVNNAFSFHLKI